MRQFNGGQTWSDLIGDVRLIVESDDADVGGAVQPERVQAEQRPDGHPVVAAHDGCGPVLTQHLCGQGVPGADRVVAEALNQPGRVDTGCSCRVEEAAVALNTGVLALIAAEERDVAMSQLEGRLGGRETAVVLVGQHDRFDLTLVGPAVDEQGAGVVKAVTAVQLSRRR